MKQMIIYFGVVEMPQPGESIFMTMYVRLSARAHDSSHNVSNQRMYHSPVEHERMNKCLSFFLFSKLSMVLILYAPLSPISI